MFYKFASNILQEIQTECIKKAALASNEQDAKMYEKISDKIGYLLRKTSVEE
jgi:hypothetical protein